MNELNFDNKKKIPKELDDFLFNDSVAYQDKVFP